MADLSPDDVITVDMAAPDAAPIVEPADALIPDASDVVIIPEREDEEDKLPRAAVLQADGSVILTLRYPVTLSFAKAGSSAPPRTESYATLHMHRLNGAAMRAIMAAGAGHTVPTGLAHSCRMPQYRFNALFDRMDGADANAAAQVFNFFLAAGAPTANGPPSSR